MRSDLGVAKGDWVRAVLIAFWDSVTTFFFQKDEGLFLTKFVLKIFCCIVSKNDLQKISDTHWLVANDLEGKNIQLYYVNLLYFDKNIVLGLMLAVSYLNLAHTHYAY